MFPNREAAGHQLAVRLKGRELVDPLVLAIPRGGLVTGAALAQGIGAELDVVLSRKLRAPGLPDVAVGAISEDGRVCMSPYALEYFELPDDYLTGERNHQLEEITRLQRLFRAARPWAPMTGRSVIVTDDGMTTGATMSAALQTIRAQHPRELIVAIPVAAVAPLEDVSHLCDAVICLHTPERFSSIGQYYKDFAPIDDEQAVKLLAHHSVPTEPAIF